MGDWSGVGGGGIKISSTDLVKLRCGKHALRHHDNKLKWTGRLAATLSTQKADPISPAKSRPQTEN